MPPLSHVDAQGEARMVDVSSKPPLLREAVAVGHILMAPSTLELVESNAIAKGNVLATARIAGIMAAKKTSDIIPLCHPLTLSHCDVDLDIPPSRDRVNITATARVTAGTGVEMEALAAVSVAALTLYDMCKAVDKSMVVSGIHLTRKSKLPLATHPIPQA